MYMYTAVMVIYTTNGGFKIELMGKKPLPIKVKYDPRFNKDDPLILIYSWYNDNTMTQQGRELIQYIGGQTHITWKS